MMLIIHGIPLKMKFAELKSIISSRCEVKDYLLDRFMIDEESKGQTKRVRVGCVDDQQALTILRKLDGLKVHDHVFNVRPFGNVELPQEPKINTWNNTNNQNYQMPSMQDNFQGYQAPTNAGPSFGPQPVIPHEPSNNSWNNLPFVPQQSQLLNNEWPPLQLNPSVSNLVNVIEQVNSQGLRFQNDRPMQPHWEGIQDVPIKSNDMGRIGPSSQNYNQFQADNFNSGPGVMGMPSNHQGPSDFRKTPNENIRRDGPSYEILKEDMEYRESKRPRSIGRANSPHRGMSDRYSHSQSEGNWNRSRNEGRNSPDRRLGNVRGISPQGPMEDSRRFNRDSPSRMSNARRRFSPSFVDERKEIDVRRSPVRDSDDVYRRIDENYRGSSYRERSPRGDWTPIRTNRDGKISPVPIQRSLGRMNSPRRMDDIHGYDDFTKERSSRNLDKGDSSKRHDSPIRRHDDEFRPPQRKSRFTDIVDKDYNSTSPEWQNTPRRRSGQDLRSRNPGDVDRFSPTPIFMNSEALKGPRDAYERSGLETTVKDRNFRQELPWEPNTGLRDSQDYIRQDVKQSLRIPSRSRSRSPVRRPHFSKERMHSPHGSWSQLKPRVHSPCPEDAPSPPSWTDNKPVPHESENNWGEKRTFDDFDAERRRSATLNFEKRNMREHMDEFKEADFKPHNLPSRSEFIQRSENLARNQDKAFVERKYYEGKKASLEVDARSGSEREPSYNCKSEREISGPDAFYREKVSERIARRVLVRHQVKPKSNLYKAISLKLMIAITKLLNNILGDRDLPIKDIHTAFSKVISFVDEDRIFDDILAGGTGDVIRLKNAGGVVCGKKRSYISRWDVGTPSIAKLKGLQQFPGVHPPVAPVVPVQVANIGSISNPNPSVFTNFMTCVGMTANAIPNPFALEPTTSNYQTASKLSLCKIDFSPFTKSEVDHIRDFVVGRIFEASASGDSGWSPTVTFKGLQTNCRYELVAEDEMSYKWLMDVDFTRFKSFGVIPYTKDELWFERASILLKDSCHWQLEPFQKLKLQNKFLEGVNIGKWKLVKQIVSFKGIQIYVDIPPSSKVALEKYNMQLSYEFQKVTVLMKTSAIDPAKFDAGLYSSDGLSMQQYASLLQNASLPITTDKGMMRLSLEDSTCNITQAKRIKDKILQTLYDYLMYNKVVCKTDFVKCGYSPPGHLVILPENKMSRNWFNYRFFGIVSGRRIVLVEDENDEVQLLRVTADIPSLLTRRSYNPAEILKIVANATVGMRINIDRWKVVDAVYPESNNSMLVIKLDIDAESVRTLHRRDFGLGFNVGNQKCYIKFRHDCPNIKRFLSRCGLDDDSYVVTNMDLDSD